MRENRTHGLTRGWRPKVRHVLRYEPTVRAGGTTKSPNRSETTSLVPTLRIRGSRNHHLILGSSLLYDEREDLTVWRRVMNGCFLSVAKFHKI